jgi:hypothetical protein
MTKATARQALPAGVAKVLKRLHYPLDVILLCVRWYVAYSLSLRNLEEMMAERGFEVDHSSVHRWVIKLVPLFEKAFRKHKRPVGKSWRMDESLRWKLAAVLRIQMPESILSSYESERRKHAWALIRLALNLGIVMAPSSTLSAFAWQSLFRMSRFIPPVRDFLLQMKFKPKPRFSTGLLGPDDARPDDRSRDAGTHTCWCQTSA